MPSGFDVVVGLFFVVVGVLWTIWPMRMSRLQSRIILFGQSDERESTEGLRRLGRAGGVLVALLGFGLAFGMFDSL